MCSWNCQRGLAIDRVRSSRRSMRSHSGDRGNTATYENVQPGADLVVSALPEGFSHLLVLKERPTEQVELRIPVAAEGVKLRQTSDERLLWEGKDGGDVATAPVPAPSPRRRFRPPPPCRTAAI